MPILDGELLHDLGLPLAGHPRRDEVDAPLWPGEFRSGPLNYASEDLWSARSFYKHVFVPAVAAVGLLADSHSGVCFHDLRHTCGSQWLADGDEMFSVSRWLGPALHRLHGRGVRPRCEGTRLHRRHRTDSTRTRAVEDKLPPPRRELKPSPARHTGPAPQRCR